MLKIVAWSIIVLLVSACAFMVDYIGRIWSAAAGSGNVPPSFLMEHYIYAVFVVSWLISCVFLWRNFVDRRWAIRFGAIFASSALSWIGFAAMGIIYVIETGVDSL